MGHSLLALVLEKCLTQYVPGYVIVILQSPSQLLCKGHGEI